MIVRTLENYFCSCHVNWLIRLNRMPDMLLVSLLHFMNLGLLFFFISIDFMSAWIRFCIQQWTGRRRVTNDLLMTLFQYIYISMYNRSTNWNERKRLCECNNSEITRSIKILLSCLYVGLIYLRHGLTIIRFKWNSRYINWNVFTQVMKSWPSIFRS